AVRAQVQAPEPIPLRRAEHERRPAGLRERVHRHAGLRAARHGLAAAAAVPVPGAELELEVLRLEVLDLEARAQRHELRVADLAVEAEVHRELPAVRRLLLDGG